MKFEDPSVSPREEKPQENRPEFETEYYEIAPQLKLEEKNADVSYQRGGESYPRRTNVYEDTNGNRWYEVYKQPRKQMAVSLLAQPFFNVSSIIEVPAANKLTRFFSKLGIPPQSQFLSKAPDLDRIKPRDRDTQGWADHLIFEEVFRDTDKGDLKHNVNYDDNTYYFYDFDNCVFYPYPGRANYLKYEKKNWDLKETSVLVLHAVAKTLCDMEKFYTNADGETFFKAVLQKSKYFSEIKEFDPAPEEMAAKIEKIRRNNKSIERHGKPLDLENIKSGNAAKFDPVLLYKGFLARIWNLMGIVSEELKVRAAREQGHAEELAALESKIEFFEKQNRPEKVKKLQKEHADIIAQSENTPETIKDLDEGMKRIENILDMAQDTGEALDKDAFDYWAHPSL